MRRRKKLLISLICLVVLLVLVAFPRRRPDPIYQGKPLSEWLVLLEPYSNKIPPEQREEAAKAVRQLGTNALPALLAWTDYEPALFRYHLLPIFGRLPFLLFNGTVRRVLIDSEAQKRASQAVEAIGILGEAATPAIPELVRRASVPWSRNPSIRRINAMTALAKLGTPAIAPLKIQLSTPAGARDLGMLDCVRLVGTNAGPLVPVLIINLNRTDWLAATLNADMLGELKLEPDVAVPALTKSLQDPRSEMRASAMRALGEFSELAKQALPALTNLLNDPDPDTRTNAATAIKRIAPKPSTAAATQ